MATIIVDCGTGVPGESSLEVTGLDGNAATHTDKLEAIGIHDLVVGSFGASRGIASEIQLVRNRDRASPKLAEKCASGVALGSVTIHIFKNDGGPKEILRLDLTSVYVSRIEYGTADSKGVAFRRHHGGEDVGAHKNTAAVQAAGYTINDARAYSRHRARPDPIFDESPGVPTDNEVERVWLNCSSVTWTAPVNVRGSFNNKTGKALAA